MTPGHEMEDDLVASKEDPYLWEIARMRRAGEVGALRQEIGNIQHYLAHSAWEDTEKKGKYSRLCEAITKAEHALKKMRMLLIAIQEVEPENK